MKFRSSYTYRRSLRPKLGIRTSNRPATHRQHCVKDKTIPPRSPEKDNADVERKIESTGKEENGHGVHTTQDAVSESWVIQVKQRFESEMYIKRQSSSDVSIYWVPATIRAPKPEAYIPLVASFGPYHHHMKLGPYHHSQKDRQIYAIDDYKLEAVQITAARIRKSLQKNDDFTICQLIAEVGDLEKKIRNCYEDSANEYSKEALSWMFTMDACFILEFFRTQNTNSPEEERFRRFFDYNGHQNIFRSEILRDIVKLENQIPLFVLTKILELECKTKENDAVSELVTFLLPFKEFCGFPFSLPSSEVEILITESRLKNNIENGAAHLLDLSRRMIKDLLNESNSQSTAGSVEDGVSCIADSAGGGVSQSTAADSAGGGVSCIADSAGGGVSQSTAGSAGGGVSCIADTFQFLSCNSSDDDFTLSAAELHKAGIIFKPSNAGDVKFEGRYFRSSTFCIPEITVDDDTEILLRNLIALEECQGCRLSPEPTIISSYIRLMDNLIDTSEDVGLFKKGKVIKSLVGSDEEIAAMINDLGKGITDNPYEPYKEVERRVKEHFKSRPKVWFGQFRQERCSKPWYVVSLVVAALLLAMAAVQTVFTVKN